MFTEIYEPNDHVILRDLNAFTGYKGVVIDHPNENGFCRVRVTVNPNEAPRVLSVESSKLILKSFGSSGRQTIPPVIHITRLQKYLNNCKIFQKP